MAAYLETNQQESGLRSLRNEMIEVVNCIYGKLNSPKVNRREWGVTYGTLMRGAYRLPVKEQSLQEVRKGILEERKNREESFAKALGLSFA